MRFVPLALGAVALVLGLFARASGSPDEVTWHGRTYGIEVTGEPEALCYDVIHAGRVAFRECGSLDTLCDPPTLEKFDVDGDGTDDLYFETCSGERYVTERGGEIVDQRLPGPPRLTWWARQVRGRGLELLAVGTLLVAGGLVAAFAGMRY